MVKRQVLAPTIERTDKYGGQTDIYRHPAFGMISMTVVTGGDRNLFGSDVQHSDRISIEIKRAKLERNLSNDWIYDTGLPIVAFEMSRAQFAQFITSGGQTGTPITLTEENGEMKPAIQPLESKINTFRREIKQASEQRIASMMAKIKELGELIESGKTSKTELRRIHNLLSQEVGSIPRNIDYVVEQANEAIDLASRAAKIDIEAFFAANSKFASLGTGATKEAGSAPIETLHNDVISGELE